MHEAAIIEDVIRQVLREAEKNRLARVSIIRLLVGRLHHVVRRTLEEIFNLMKMEFPIISDATLKVKVGAVRFVCRPCGRETEADTPSFSCPICHSTDIRIISGYELILARIEGEQHD